MAKSYRLADELRRTPSGEVENYKDIRCKSIRMFYCPECGNSFEHLKKYQKSGWSYGSLPEKLPRSFNPFNTLRWDKQICEECGGQND